MHMRFRMLTHTLTHTHTYAHTYSHAHAQLALDQDSGTLCAVKIIKTDALGDADSSAMRSIANEINVMKDLSHPHIVRYIATTTTAENIHIFMEYGSETKDGIYA